MKTDLKEDIKEVKADIKTLDKRFQNLEKQIVLIKWMLGVVIVAVIPNFTKYLRNSYCFYQWKATEPA